MSAKLGSQGAFAHSVSETITAAKTLVASDSGKVFFLDSSGGAYTITLPSAKASVHFLFFVQEDTPTGAITIAAGSAIIDGMAMSGTVSGDTSGAAGIESTNGTAVSNVIIGTGAKQGSHLEFFSDGTTYYFRGAGDPDDWITTS